MNKYLLSKSELGIYTSIAGNNSLCYNLPFVMELPKVSKEQVENALKEIIKVHPYLDTHFEEDDKLGVIKYHQENKFSLKEEDYPASLISLVKHFSLKDDALYRFKLLKKGDKKYLFFDFHHLIMDGNSINLFIKDFFKALKGEALDKEIMDANEVSEKEDKDRKSPKFEKAKNYYLKNFDGIETDSVPVYDKDDGTPSYNHLKVRLDVDKKKINSFVTNLGIKTSSFFNGAFGYFMKVISGNEDSLFLSITNGRDKDNIYSYGMFVHTFLVHSAFKDEDAIKDYLVSIDKQMKKNIENDLYSYADIVKDIGLKSEVLFAYQGDAFYNVDGVHAEEIKTKDGKEKYSFEVFRDEKGYFVSMEYRSDLFNEETIRHEIKVFNYVINEFLTKKAIKDIVLVSQEDILEMEKHNDTDISYIDLHDTVVDHFLKIVKKYPTHTAVVYKDKKYTYKEVDKISTRLANALVKLGAKVNAVVPILIDRGENMALVTFGVIKTGAAYMPLDATYPTERLEFMIEDSGAKLIVLDRNLEDKIPNCKCKKVYTDELDSFKDETPLKIKYKPNDLFVMLYTSGTTGKPKGVQIENMNVLSMALTHIKNMKLDSSRKVAAYASYGFDANLMDLYGTLLSGACEYIVPEDMRLDLIALGKQYDEWGITDAFMTTTVGRQFATEISSKSLINFSTGGEKLVPFDAGKLKYNFYNLYGPTEGVVYCNGHKVEGKEYRVLIGPSTPDYKIYVVDKFNHRLPYFVPGELVISSLQIARGYLNRPEATEKAFLKNPFTKDPSFSRAYRTGDVVRMLPDGSIDFIGRADGQVKIRGFRIELTEVESVIREFKGVKEATVKDFTDNMGIKYIVGYVVSDNKVDFDELKKFILSKKPPYMVPAYFMELDALPLNQNHKVNKRALPEPTLTKADAVKPRNKEEQVLVDIVKELLGYEVGVKDDLDEAGLTSVTSIRFVVLISKAFNKAIKISDLESLHNIEDIASFLGGKVEEEKLEVLDAYPLTKTQEGIFVECFKNTGTTMYNIPTLIKLDDKLDLKELQNALVEALKNHPYILTHLSMDKDGNIKAKPQETKVKVEIIKKEIEKDQLVRPFTLLDGDLYRVEIYNTKKGNYLFMDFHHIIFDGTSETVLFEDISKALDHQELEKEGLSGYQIGQVEEKERKTEALTKAKEFYGEYLKELEDASCLMKKEPLADKTPLLKSFDIKPALKVSVVDKFIKDNKLTANALFNLAFAYTLSKFSNREDAYYTTIFNGRLDSRMSHSTSMLVKTLPVYHKFNEDNKIIDDIKIMQKGLVGLENNSIYSFGEAVKDYSLNADVMFAYQGDNFELNKLGKYNVETVILESEDAKTPLSIDVFIEKGVYRVHLEYDASYFREKMMRSFGLTFVHILEEFLQKKAFKEVTFLSEEDKALYDRFNDTDAPIKEKAFYHYLEASAKRVPNKVAVIGKEGKYTYKEFNENVNKVAHALVDLKGKVGEKTIMLMPRIAGAYIVRQGILKSGTAFVPLDPHYPDERISYIIEDSEAKYLITTKEILDAKKDLLKKAKIKILIYEDILKSNKIANLGLDIKPTDLAYSIYTSGSTGKPKGVLLSEENLCNYVTRGPSNTSIYEYEKNGEDSVSCSFASFAFDASLQEEVVPLALGHTIYIASEEDIENPMLLAEHLKEHKVDTMFLTPSYVTNVLEFDEVMSAFRNFKTLDMGAEAVPVSLITKLKELGVKADFFNGYGPTETTITSTYSREVENGTIGKPMVNTHLYIVDKQRRILPLGATGELVIGGKGVGIGYYKLEEKTKANYIMINNERAYCTGDMARYNFDGDIEYFGRMDNQIKLHGLRIELDEIENNILKYPDVSQVKVIVANKESEDFLVAYFTGKKEISTEKLIEFISKHLTPYMVPKVFMQLEKMPLTPNGKIDKKALPEPENKVSNKKKVIEANDQLEQDLLEIFKKALNQDDVSTDDDFFELGGTSLSASKVTMIALSKGIKVDYKDVFEYPSVKALASHIREINGISEPKVQNKIQKDVKVNEQISSLKENVIENVNKLTSDYKLKKVLVTGATGFLGIHVLRELINEGVIVYGLVRPNKLSSDDRLKTMLAYYFSDPFLDKFNKTLFTLPYDVTDENLKEQLKDLEFDTIINCAALVKHFAKDDIIERVNAGGAKNIAEIALEHHARMIQISTLSVAGVSVDNNVPEYTLIHENELEIGQDISNKYVHSKYDAEKIVLEMIRDKGLDAKIIRVGNLMGRNSDGEFQINSLTNGFMRDLSSYIRLGVFPLSSMDSKTDFTPIDKVAEGVIKLSSTNKEFTLFHLSNSHTLDMADVIYALNNYGKKVEIVSDEEFSKKLVEASQNEEEAEKVASLLAYNISDGHTYRYIGSDNSFTTKVLYRLGFHWPITDESYLEKAIEAVDTLGMF